MHKYYMGRLNTDVNMQSRMSSGVKQIFNRMTFKLTKVRKTF